MDIATETKIIIRWHTRNENTIRRIRERFNVPAYTTINGWSPASLKEADRELLDETAQRGFISYMAVKNNRRGIGCELKDSYFATAVKNIKKAEGEVSVPSLFD